jgi:protein involved in polysaccharide export with SLBB domain
VGRRKDLAFMSALRRLAILGIALAAVARAAPAQQPTEAQARRVSATRVELTDLLARMDSQTPPALASLVQSRLTDGDLRPGDGIILDVRGEPQLTDTFVVDGNMSIPLPDVGSISLRGVLFSELESHMRLQIAQYVRDPAVRATPMVRMLVGGAVSRPGYYLVPADALISQTLMAAGGVTGDAEMKKLRAMRAGYPVLEGPEMQKALAQGLTLDRANLRTGDELFVPAGASGPTRYERVRTFATLLTIPITIYTLTKIF